MARKHAAISIGILLAMIGILVLSYPLLSRYIYKKKQEELILQYQELQEEMQEDGESKAGKETAFEEIQCFLEIPSLQEYLPVYLSTEEADLRRGVGVLEGSNLPGGGNGSHCVLCGHAGFAKASLFSKLYKLEIGDEFYLYLGKEQLTYQVNQILVVKPEEQEALLPVDGKNYVTLLTCTPPGKNTYRLLVRGEKTE